MHGSVRARTAALDRMHGGDAGSRMLRSLERWAARTGADVGHPLPGGARSLVVDAFLPSGRVVVKVAPPSHRTLTAAEADCLDVTCPAGTVVDTDPSHGVLVMRHVTGTLLDTARPDPTSESEFVARTVTSLADLPAPERCPTASSELARSASRAFEFAVRLGDAAAADGISRTISRLNSADDEPMFAALDVHPKNVLAAPRSEPSLWALIDPWPAVGDPAVAWAKWAVVRCGPGGRAGDLTGVLLDRFERDGAPAARMERWLPAFAAHELGWASPRRHTAVLEGPLREWLVA